MKKYDVAIIGSSPICMAEAIYHVSQGKSVCIIERGALGGSWKIGKGLDFQFLEVGPHVFNGPKQGCKSFQLFGLKPIKAKLAYFDINESKLYKQNLFAMRHYEKALYWLGKIFENKINFAKLAYNIIKCVQHILSPKKEYVCYLGGGTVELIHAFLQNKYWKKIDLIKRSCLDLRKNEHSENIDLILEENEVITTNELIMTGCSDLDMTKICQRFSVDVDIEEVKFVQREFKSCQIVMLIDDNKKKNSFTSFIANDSNYIGNQNFLMKKKIKYFNDITHYVVNANQVDLKKDSFNIITLAVDPDEYKKEVKDVYIDIDMVMQDLKRLRLISDESIVLDTYQETVIGKIMNSSDIEIFNSKIKSSIRIMKSENLMVAFSENYKRWKRVL